jgi:hypothetical protein
MKVWIAGQRPGAGEWELLGIFSSREKAIAACEESSDFVAEMELDQPFPREKVTFPCEWPLLDKAVAS